MDGCPAEVRYTERMTELSKAIPAGEYPGPALLGNLPGTQIAIVSGLTFTLHQDIALKYLKWQPVQESKDPHPNAPWKESEVIPNSPYDYKVGPLFTWALTDADHIAITLEVIEKDATQGKQKMRHREFVALRYLPVKRAFPIAHTGSTNWNWTSRFNEAALHVRELILAHLIYQPLYLPDANSEDQVRAVVSGPDWLRYSLLLHPGLSEDARVAAILADKKVS